MARAIPRRCFIPRERPTTNASYFVSKPSTAMTSRTQRGNFRGVELVGAREVLDVFPGFQVIVDGEKVGPVADVLLRFLRFLFDVNIIDSDASGRGQH